NAYTVYNKTNSSAAPNLAPRLLIGKSSGFGNPPVGVSVLPSAQSTTGYVINVEVGGQQASSPRSSTASAAPSVAEGAFVIISDDQITTPLSDRGKMNGRIFRVGNRRPDLDTYAGMYTWEVAPGSE